MREDSIFLINSDGSLEEVPHKDYESEDLLQQLVESHPAILAGEQINSDNPPRWLLVKREAGIPDRQEGSNRWSVDHLLLDQNGVPTFVEVKRSSDTRIRREVVGQMLDYAANANVYWPENRIRAMATETSGGSESALEQKLIELLNSEESQDFESNIEEYWKLVEENLRSGKVRLLFVADSIPSELRRIIEFLNEHMPRVEVLGIELRQYEGQNIRALVPRVIGQTEFIKQQKNIGTKSSQNTTCEEFLENCPVIARRFFQELLHHAESFDYQIDWGQRGFSLRLQTLSGGLSSPFWGFPTRKGASPELWARLHNIKNNEINIALRREILSKAPFIESGQNTLKIVLDDDKKVASITTAIKDLLQVAKNYFVVKN